MITFSPAIIIEIFIGFLLWWVAIYLITQNPFSRSVQLSFGIIAAIGLYFTSDILFVTSTMHDYSAIGWIMKSMMWTIYLPYVLLYHISYLFTEPKLRKLWQKYFLFVAYLMFLLITYLEIFTNYTRNYKYIFSPQFNGDIASATGKYFWLIGVMLISITIATAFNFYQILIRQPKFSHQWYKFFWPFLGLVLINIIGPIILLSYYRIIPHSNFFAIIGFSVAAIPLIYSIIKYDLLIEESKIVFGKNFLYSTLGILLIIAIYIGILFTANIKFTTIQSVIFPYIFIHLIITTHPAYNWLNTFYQDLIYNFSSGLSVVTDQEVYMALRNYNHPENLENNSLLRLHIIEKYVRSQKASTPVDALRHLLKECVDYFHSSQEGARRTKQNLKYHLLKMVAFDEAEEGQILWELGYEEYPMKIITQESTSRPPLFKPTSPSDYSYISRNAYMALKKEAIHAVAWRISYLEKMSLK